MDRSLRFTGNASIFLISVLAVHKIFAVPIIAVAIRHLNNCKSVRLGIGGIELASGLVILDSVVMPIALETSVVLWATLSVLVRKPSSGGRFNAGKAIFFALDYVLRCNFSTSIF